MGPPAGVWCQGEAGPCTPLSSPAVVTKKCAIFSSPTYYFLYTEKKKTLSFQNFLEKLLLS